MVTPSFTALALVCAAFDWRSHRIPYYLTIPLLALGLVIGPHWLAGFVTLAVLMGGYLLLLRLGRPAYWDADAMLGAAFAALLGWPLVGIALVLAGVLALAVQAVRRRVEPYTYGPYIVGCGLVALLLQRYGS